MKIPLTPTFTGQVYALNDLTTRTSELDALLLFEACHRQSLAYRSSRLSDSEKKSVSSGNIFIFNDKAPIRRWTDGWGGFLILGLHWTASRAFGNFFVYRQVFKVKTQDFGQDLKRIENVDGLRKKVVRAKHHITGEIWTLVSYYKDGDLGFLVRPTAIEDLMKLQVSFEIVEITKSSDHKYHGKREVERGRECGKIVNLAPGPLEILIADEEELKSFPAANDLHFGSLLY